MPPQAQRRRPIGTRSCSIWCSSPLARCRTTPAGCGPTALPDPSCRRPPAPRGTGPENIGPSRRRTRLEARAGRPAGATGMPAPRSPRRVRAPSGAVLLGRPSRPPRARPRRGEGALPARGAHQAVEPLDLRRQDLATEAGEAVVAAPLVAYGFAGVGPLPGLLDRAALLQALDSPVERARPHPHPPAGPLPHLQHDPVAVALPVGQRQQHVQRSGRQGQEASRIAQAITRHFLTAHNNNPLHRSVPRYTVFLCIVTRYICRGMVRRLGTLVKTGLPPTTLATVVPSSRAHGVVAHSMRWDVPYTLTSENPYSRSSR